MDLADLTLSVEYGDVEGASRALNTLTSTGRGSSQAARDITNAFNQKAQAVGRATSGVQAYSRAQGELIKMLARQQQEMQQVSAALTEFKEDVSGLLNLITGSTAKYAEAAAALRGFAGAYGVASEEVVLLSKQTDELGLNQEQSIQVQTRLLSVLQGTGPEYDRLRKRIEAYIGAINGAKPEQVFVRLTKSLSETQDSMQKTQDVFQLLGNIGIDGLRKIQDYGRGVSDAELEVADEAERTTDKLRIAFAERQQMYDADIRKRQRLLNEAEENRGGVFKSIGEALTPSEDTVLKLKALALETRRFIELGDEAVSAENVEKQSGFFITLGRYFEGAARQAKGFIDIMRGVYEVKGTDLKSTLAPEAFEEAERRITRLTRLIPQLKALRGAYDEYAQAQKDLEREYLSGAITGGEKIQYLIMLQNKQSEQMNPMQGVERQRDYLGQYSAAAQQTEQAVTDLAQAQSEINKLWEYGATSLENMPALVRGIAQAAIELSRAAPGLQAVAKAFQDTRSALADANILESLAGISDKVTPGQLEQTRQNLQLNKELQAEIAKIPRQDPERDARIQELTWAYTDRQNALVRQRAANDRIQLGQGVGESDFDRQSAEYVSRAGQNPSSRARRQAEAEVARLARERNLGDDAQRILSGKAGEVQDPDLKRILNNRTKAATAEPGSAAAQQRRELELTVRQAKELADAQSKGVEAVNVVTARYEAQRMVLSGIAGTQQEIQGLILERIAAERQAELNRGLVDLKGQVRDQQELLAAERQGEEALRAVNVQMQLRQRFTEEELLKNGEIVKQYRQQFEELEKVNQARRDTEARRGVGSTRQANEDFERAVRDAEDRRKRGAFNEEEYNRAVLNAERQRLEASREGWDGVKRGMLSYFDEASNAALQYERLFTTSMSRFEDVTRQMIMTGKADWKGLFKSMLADFMVMQQRMLTSQLFQTILNPGSINSSGAKSSGGVGGLLGGLGGLGGLFGGISGLFGGGGGGAGSSAWNFLYNSGGAMAGGLYANGAAFLNGRVTAFASGGVLGGPTVFPMANGVGLAGEAGPEAVMPLRRMASGRLGVESNDNRRGSSGSSFIFQIDARGAEVGVEEKIDEVLTRRMPEIARYSMAASARESSLGGAYSRAVGRARRNS